MISWQEMVYSPVFWICGILLALTAIFQSYLFVKVAFRTGRFLKLERKTMTNAIRSSLITGIGPNLAIAVSMIALIIAFSPGIAFQREINAVGSVTYELTTAQLGANAAGQTFGAPGFDWVGLAGAVFAMNVGCIGWIFVGGFFIKSLMKLRNKMSGGDTELLMILSVTCILGAFSSLMGGYIVAIKGTMVACLLSILIAGVWYKTCDITRRPGLKQYALFMSMLISVLVAQAVFP